MSTPLANSSHSGPRRASHLDAHGSGSDGDSPSGEPPRKPPTFRPPKPDVDVPPTLPPPPPLGAPPPGSVRVERPPRRRSSIDAITGGRRGRRFTLDDGWTRSAARRQNLLRGSHSHAGPTFRPPSSSEGPWDASLPQGADPINNDGSNGDTGGRLLSRRTSMSDMEQVQRRASIQLILQDGQLDQLEKRRSIQALMDGRRRTSIDGDGPTNPLSEVLRREGLSSSRRRSNSFDEGSDGGSGVEEGMNRRGTDASSESVDPTPVAVRPFANAAAPWADAENHTASAESAALAGPASAPWPGSSAPDGSDSDDEGIHVPDHAAFAAAAKHRPYNAASAGAPPRHAESDAEWAQRAVEAAPPCAHYERNCHIVGPCCGAAFGCRLCHDDCSVLLPPLLDATTTEGTMLRDAAAGGRGAGGDGMPASLNASIVPPEHHTLDRFAIKEIICRECFTKQSSKTNFCVNCNVRFGEYHCAVCNLWMSNGERPYHCPDCGFCRVGGSENFRHCDDCGVCIDRQLFADHNCTVGKYMSNCPVCQEGLFSSRDASHELPCGHAIHWHCFRELASHDSRCPTCKSFVVPRTYLDIRSI